MTDAPRAYRAGIAAAATLAAIVLYVSAIVLWPLAWYGRGLAILLALAAYAAAETALAAILVPASGTTRGRRYSYDQILQGMAQRDRSRRHVGLVFRSIVALAFFAGLIWLVPFVVARLTRT